MKRGILFLIFLAIISIVVFTVKYETEIKTKKQPDLEVPQSTVEISRGSATKKQVIFTFDGGSGAESGEKILEVLKKHNVTGTFFLTGKFVEANPELVRKIVAEGHQVFNHTYNHPYLTKISDGEIAKELEKMNAILESTANVSSKPFFRPPYGDRDAKVLAAAAKAGYRSVYWTIDALDWKEESGETAAQVKNRILLNASPGTIYLMHIGDSITGNILDGVFTEIESRGYKVVSLTEGM